MGLHSVKTEAKQELWRRSLSSEEVGAEVSEGAEAARWLLGSHSGDTGLSTVDGTSEAPSRHRGQDSYCVMVLCLTISHQ